jgi:hypothetical protein
VAARTLDTFFLGESLVRWVRTLAVALVAGAALLLFQYGTLSPCGILRVEARQHAAHDGGGAGLLATAASDSVLDTLLAVSRILRKESAPQNGGASWEDQEAGATGWCWYQRRRRSSNEPRRMAIEVAGSFLASVSDFE